MHLFIIKCCPFFLLGILPYLSYACPAHAKRDSASLALDTSRVIPFPFPESQAPVLEDALSKIESIPDTVLDEGKYAAAEWLKSAENDTNVVTTRALIEGRQSWIAIVKCALEITKAVVENGFPLAKLRRFKELISLLGGAKAVAKMLLKAKTLKEFLIIGGAELAEIGQMLLGLRGVVNACFDWV
ncbi:MAG: hypothetical protein Q9226_001875 [Calogaya cf. arnoldii]